MIRGLKGAMVNHLCLIWSRSLFIYLAAIGLIIVISLVAQDSYVAYMAGLFILTLLPISILETSASSFVSR